MADINITNMTAITEGTTVEEVITEGSVIENIISESIQHSKYGTLPTKEIKSTLRKRKNINLASGITLFIKRIFDILLSMFALIVLALPMSVISCIVYFNDRGQVFYRGQRIGKNGKPFYIYKFRTMKPNAENPEAFLSKRELEEFYRVYKLKNDPRITRCGKWLRRTSLDELPQFFNVLIGNMSLVGPRPVTEEETLLYNDDRDLFLSVRPGITGYWQAYARDRVTYEDGKRQAMELKYIKNRSLWFDIKILFRTVYAVIFDKEPE